MNLYLVEDEFLKITVKCHLNYQCKEKLFVFVNCFNLKEKNFFSLKVPLKNTDSTSYTSNFTLNIKNLPEDQEFYLNLSCMNFNHKTLPFKIAKKSEINNFIEKFEKIFIPKQIRIERVSKKCVKKGDDLKLHFSGDIQCFITPLSKYVIEIDGNILKGCFKFIRDKQQTKLFVLFFDSPLNFKKDTKIRFYIDDKFICEYAEDFQETSQEFIESKEEEKEILIKDNSEIIYDSIYEAFDLKDGKSTKDVKDVDIWVIKKSKDSFGLTPLDWLMKLQNWKVAEILFESGLQINEKTLHLIFSNTRVLDFIKELKSNGPRVYFYFLRDLVKYSGKKIILEK